MQPQKNPDNLTVNEALQAIHDASKPFTQSEWIPSKDGENRILTENLNAQRDIPKFDNSAMDGFLFRTDDLEKGVRTFRIQGEIRPEDSSADAPGPKSCKRIMTGAPVPDGKFTVVPVEQVKENSGEVDVLGIPKRNPVRKQGEGYKKGKPVMPKNTLIRPYEMGLMIESGNQECHVKKNIRVAVQVTGSEIDEDMDSNGPVLEGLIRSWPGTAIKRWPVLDDDPALVIARMQELKTSADVVLTTGGISMGRHDYILEAMKQLGAEVIVRKVQQKPGKPFTVTKLDDTLFFHLPGNPVSAVFTAEFYTRRAMYTMLGLQFPVLSAVSVQKLSNHRPDKTLFTPARLEPDHQNRLSVNSEGVMRSHLLQLYRNCNAYIRLEPKSSYQPGDLVEVIPFSTTRIGV
jgi:molybdopterin molybdotransferase